MSWTSSWMTVSCVEEASGRAGRAQNSAMAATVAPTVLRAPMAPDGTQPLPGGRLPGGEGGNRPGSGGNPERRAPPRRPATCTCRRR